MTESKKDAGEEVRQDENVLDADDEKRLRARKIAKRKADFIKHFIIFFIVIVFLAIINNVTSPGGYQWWLWPALGWGIGVTLNFFSVYVFKGKELEERIMRSELDKMDHDL